MNKLVSVASIHSLLKRVSLEQNCRVNLYSFQVTVIPSVSEFVVLQMLVIGKAHISYMHDPTLRINEHFKTNPALATV